MTEQTDLEEFRELLSEIYNAQAADSNDAEAEALWLCAEFLERKIASLGGTLPYNPADDKWGDN